MPSTKIGSVHFVLDPQRAILRPAVLPDLNRGETAYELASAQQNAHRLWINIDFSLLWQLEYPLK